MERNTLFLGIPYACTRRLVAPEETALRKGTRLSLPSPGACLGKVQRDALGEDNVPLALLLGKACETGDPAMAGTAGGWQETCHLLSVWRKRSLAAKKGRAND